MKIKLITIALLAYYGSVSAQVEINLNKVVSFNMPAGTEKFRDEKYINEMSILSANSVVEKSTQNTYKFRDIIFRFNAAKNPSGQNYLSYLKERWGRAFAAEKNGYSSEIKRIGENEVLVAKYKNYEGRPMYKIMCYNALRKLAFGSDISYDKGDEEIVRSTLADLYKTIKFL